MRKCGPSTYEKHLVETIKEKDQEIAELKAEIQSLTDTANRLLLSKEVKRRE